VSYLAVIASLLMMKLRPRPAAPHPDHILRALRDGFVYAFGFAPIRTILLLFALVCLTGTPFTVLMPVFAQEVLHGGPNLLGLLMAASGVGALAGALYLAMRRSILGLGRVIGLTTALFGAALIAFSYSRVAALSMALLAVGGFGMMVQMAAVNTILQTIVEDDKRGRVMSFYTMAFVGMMPFGSLFAGILATRLGAPLTVALGGAACIVGAGVFMMRLAALRDQVRPIYVLRGIVPAVVTGVNTAAEIGAANE
jgi:predicted MFS family arabinose efflux permease